MDEQKIAELTQKMMKIFGAQTGSESAIQVANLTAMMAASNAKMNQAQQRPPSPPPPPEKPKPLEFHYKKRRGRTVLKRFPFQMDIRNGSDEVRDEMDAYLEMVLGPRGQEWSRTGWSNYVFTKKQYAVQMMIRFRGTQ